jgi:hypothetical protein
MSSSVFVITREGAGKLYMAEIVTDVHAKAQNKNNISDTEMYRILQHQEDFQF